jgi:hypothetical protein
MTRVDNIVSYTAHLLTTGSGAFTIHGTHTHTHTHTHTRNCDMMDMFIFLTLIIISLYIGI